MAKLLFNFTLFSCYLVGVRVVYLGTALVAGRWRETHIYPLFDLIDIIFTKVLITRLWRLLQFEMAPQTYFKALIYKTFLLIFLLRFNFAAGRSFFLDYWIIYEDVLGDLSYCP